MDETTIIKVHQVANISSKNKERYEEARNTLRTSLRESYEAKNVMVKILHEDNPTWSMNQIAKFITAENRDISVRSIYNHLDDENKELIEKKYNPTQKKGKVKVASLQPTKKNGLREYDYSKYEKEAHKLSQQDIKQFLYSLTAIETAKYMKKHVKESKKYRQNLSAYMNWISGKRELEIVRLCVDDLINELDKRIKNNEEFYKSDKGKELFGNLGKIMNKIVKK
jgi:hypothetical protein